MILAIKSKVKDKALDFRNLERLVHSDDFALALSRDPGNVFIDFAISSGNVNEVKAWIERTITREVGEMSMRQLRARAAKLEIPRYSMYDKDELIVKIIQAQDARKAQATAG